jgi:uncharacterized protein YcgI (DUF1989 family)
MTVSVIIHMRPDCASLTTLGPLSNIEFRADSFPGGWMAILLSHVVLKNSGAVFELKKGQRLRIAGRSIVDFVAFNRHDFAERFDQARTKTNQAKIFISTGDILYSKRNNPMLTIVEDTFKEGRHDLQKGMCSRQRFEMVAAGAVEAGFCRRRGYQSEASGGDSGSRLLGESQPRAEAMEYRARRCAEPI